MQTLSLKELSFVHTDPETIRHMHRHPDRPLLAVARQHSTLLLALPSFDELALLPPARFVFFSPGHLWLVSEYSLAKYALPREDAGSVLPQTRKFESQCNHAALEGGRLVTAHQDYCRAWEADDPYLQGRRLSEGGLCYSGGWVLSGNQLRKRGAVINPHAEVSTILLAQNWVAVGTASGCLKLYDQQTGFLQFQFQDLQAPVLAMLVLDSVLYVSGCDSRVVAYRLGSTVSRVSTFRGQSHDVLTLCVLGPTELASGGITTDICVYQVSNPLQPKVARHHPLLNGFSRLSAARNLVLVNRGARIQLFSLRPKACIFHLCSEQSFQLALLSPDTRFVLVSAPDSSLLHLQQDYSLGLTEPLPFRISLASWFSESVAFAVSQNQLLKIAPSQDGTKCSVICETSLQFSCILAIDKKESLIGVASRLEQKVELFNFAGELLHVYQRQFYGFAIISKCLFFGVSKGLQVERVDGEGKKTLGIPCNKARMILPFPGAGSSVLVVGEAGCTVVNGASKHFSRAKHRVKFSRTWRMQDVALGEGGLLATRLDFDSYFARKGSLPVLSKRIM